MSDPPNELKILIKDQNTTGALIKKFVQNTDKLGAANLTLDTLRNRLDVLDKYWKQFCERHTELSREVETLSEQSYFVNDEYSEIEIQFTVAKSYITEKLAGLYARAQDNAAAPTGNMVSQAIQLTTTATSLPKLDLPKFTGKQSEWDSFQAIFTSMVKDVPTLTPTLKLQHLLRCVEGEAARTLSNIEITGPNFDIAWAALSRRYENKRLRISTYMKRLLYMQPATKKSVPDYIRLLDTTNECRRGLLNLGEPVDQWDRWFVSLTVFKLDEPTREDWEQSLNEEDLSPPYDKLVRFLESKIHALDTAHCPDPDRRLFTFKGATPPGNKNSKSVSAQHATTSPPPKKALSCILCKAEHRIGGCPTFLEYSVEDRWKVARERGLCFNCLSKQHITTACQSKYRCQVCKRLHHMKLHQSSPNAQTANSSSVPDSGQTSLPDSVSSTITSHATLVNGNALLGTAQVVGVNANGDRLAFRALIDPGSEGSFITEKAAQALSLRKTLMPLSVTGVGGYLSATTKAVVSLTLRSVRSSKPSVILSAAVLPRLSSLLPRCPIQDTQWRHLQGLNLADPSFATPAPVDCLIGADIYPEVIREGLQRGPIGSPSAQNTIFGWVLTGPTNSPQGSTRTGVKSFNTTVAPLDSLRDQIHKLWELEELPNASALTPDEEECEAHFLSSHQRDDSGRFVVRLPFKSPPSSPGSRFIAKQRLLSLERRLQTDGFLQQEYIAFMTAYEQLGHMKKSAALSDSQEASYLPHHAVVTQHNNKKKLRVVFNASQRASNAKSLNDYLHVGHKLQQDISTILLRWRFGRVAFTADIVKMFRQIRVHDDDTRWQRILWRSSPEEPILDYDLTTVTYGTACAPYLALRVLQQLAQDEQCNFPLGARILMEHMYVDDALVCADTEAEALEARSSLVGILRTAGMELDKWASNSSTLVFDSGTRSASDRLFDKELSVPTLGLRWTPATDMFSYQAITAPLLPSVTKRCILSEVARIYDPMGWITPVTSRAKLLIQNLWRKGLDWDTPADEATTQAWLETRVQLHDLQSVAIPRWLGTVKNSTGTLHGFSDASEKAYAAVVYLAPEDSDTVSIIAAKSKVDPVKGGVSLARLELCGALLLARLMANLLKDCGFSERPVYCWTDSEIVLGWIRRPPCTWTTFIANRIGEIQRLIPTAHWAHVHSKDNPADLDSRGCTPNQLQADPLWWHGPPWLLSQQDFPPKIECETSQEKRAEKSCFMALPEENIETILARFSSLHHMYRIIATCLRWKTSGRAKAGSTKGSPLSAQELNQVRTAVTRAVQSIYFVVEVTNLSKYRTIPKNSSLRRHRPFLDEQGLLRVGGRLQQSALPYPEKHPLIIPKESRLAELLILDAHIATLHGGPQLVQSFLLRRWWIIHGRNKIRHLISACVICARFQGRKQEQLMAPLPATRITPARPFTETGVDYAGPFFMRTSKGRGQRSYKGYVAVFTCMVTRAVHLEIVSDYSTKTFLLALRRFIERRGLCRRIISDRGTTFQGAASDLQHLFNEASAFSKEVAASIANDGIAWDFIPPRAPHFGGLWEAAVKAFKAHLKRVVGEAKLTFEEFSTLAAQIEACLNSRPLSPISADPQDLSALTPGHFLIGSALLSPPEPFSDENVSAVARWKITTQMRNHFWRRWRKEVLQHMQLRQKWLTVQPSLAIGDLVLLTDDQQPPLKWPLSRVLQLHPGPDGFTRVVTLRTPTTTLQRPITKLIKLPINEKAAVQGDEQLNHP